MAREEFHAVRTDIEGNLLKKLELAPGLAERIRGGNREAKFVGTGVLPNYFRKPYGQGWALVGDAGYHKDPYMAQGITDAFRNADLLAEAIDAGLSERRPLEETLADYERQRNAAALPAYELNCQLARLGPRPPRCSSSSPPCKRIRRKPIASSVLSKARCRSRSSSRQRISSGSLVWLSATMPSPC